ncbi:MAG: hypothetical protein MI861_17475 [Pirellulales bacterium]|nr:hypothetical protein [Pirellulales bacterium]
MAGVACVSVLADGKKFGTVYLARTPQENQETLSKQLTSLLTATIRSCAGAVPELVDVTDAGKIETAYWKNVLRRFFVDGRRVKLTRVVDYYHASERLTTIADALKSDSDSRSEWLSRVRIVLQELACKQIVSQRLKLAGMRWQRGGAQVVVTLRSILWSGIWDAVYEKWLDSKPVVIDLIQTKNG